MSEGDTAADKDILAELDREASDYLKVRLYPTLAPLFPPFLLFPPSPEVVREKKERKGKGSR